MGGVLLIMFRTLFASGHGIGVGRIFHKLMLNRVLQAPISFFDVTPAGRLSLPVLHLSYSTGTRMIVVKTLSILTSLLYFMIYLYILIILLFHVTHHPGRIINKFTSDLALSDQGSSAIVSIVITLFVEVCVSCITVCVVTR